MARPTKEEATAWMELVHRQGLDGTGLTGRHCDLLWEWIKRVRASLPSAAAAQRDRKRRKKVDPETCPGCGCSPSECACPSGQYK